MMAERGKFPAPEAIGLISQACQALDAAHHEGIVHRDLKPQNIMVQKDGRVVVTDFGIAHSEDAPTATATGAIIGTPEYMSPEQARGRKVDQRSDIFSLGLIFYELLTGKLPFKGDTAPDTMFKRIQERAIPPAEIERTVPAHANQVVIRCLETDPDKRYPNAAALLSDLKSIDPARPVTNWNRLVYRLSQKQPPWKSAIALLMGVVLGIGVYFFRDTTGPPATKKIVQVLISDFSVEPGVLDTPLEPVLTLALEGASFVEVADRQRAKNVAVLINAKQTRLDEETARLVAVR